MIIELSLDDRKIILVGTAHVSDESVNLVEEVIEREKPDIVAVELCKQRHHSLMEEKKWDETEINEVVKSGKTHLFLIQLLLSNFQRRVGDKVNVKPGAEMKKAVELASEKGIELALVDRDVKVTLKRAFQKMTLIEKAKLLYGFLEGMIEGEEIDKELIEKLKEKDILSEMLDELGREIPSIKRVLVDERDEYIALKIRKLEGKKIVAVLGAGHLEGIKKHIEEKTKGSVKALEVIEEKKSKMRYIGWSIPLLIIGLFGVGLITHDFNYTFDLFIKWFIIQGTMSALGAALALAHPLTILVTFFAAPAAVLHPLIAVGWISAVVELRLRKPRVSDFKGLVKLNSITDWWGNRVTRIILVLMLANLGGTLSTLVVIPYLAFSI